MQIMLNKIHEQRTKVCKVEKAHGQMWNIRKGNKKMKRGMKWKTGGTKTLVKVNKKETDKGNENEGQQEGLSVKCQGEYHTQKQNLGRGKGKQKMRKQRKYKTA